MLQMLPTNVRLVVELQTLLASVRQLLASRAGAKSHFRRVRIIILGRSPPMHFHSSS